MNADTIKLTVEDVPLRLAAVRRDGPKPPLLCLHGFGSTKEDYAGLSRLPGLEERSFLAYDAPGCGDSACADLTAISIPFLCQTALVVIDHYNLAPFHLIGHSMGGLTALKLAQVMGPAVLSFTNIEGNLGPEDCFLSRQIIDHHEADEDLFLEHFVARVRKAADVSSAPYAAGLSKNVRAGAVRPIFRSMVGLSDGDDLLNQFLGLPMPRLFVHGEQNRSLSYLGRLRRAGIQLTEIPRSGHFPMYANPAVLWRQIGAFIEQVEKETNHE